MLHLDTNALIALPQWARLGTPLVARVLEGESAAVCSMVWYEYAVGPLKDKEAELARAFLKGGVVAITEKDATLAAELYNVAGRQRRLKSDALIAAVAIDNDADFATINADDFQPFVGHGLRLIEAEL